jgi:integrase
MSITQRSLDDGHIQIIKEAVRTSSVDGRTRVLAPTTLVNVRQMVRSAFRNAHKRRLIDADPWDGVDWSSPRDAEQVDADLVMDRTQVMRLAKTCAKPHGRYLCFVLVQGFCGLRPSEARDLRRRDFDLETTPATVTVAGSYTDVSDRYLDEGESRERPLKGRGPKARRTVPIPEQLVPYFRGHLEEYVPDRQDALVFTTPTGRRINLANFHRLVWRPTREAPFEENTPLRRVRRHDLRHSAITGWLNSGVLPKTAQQWSGHRRLSVLLDTYVGVMREDAATSLKRVEEALAVALDELEDPEA